MRPYTAQDFWVDLRNDIWVLKQIGELPHDPTIVVPSTYDEKTGITTNYMVSESDICMPARQEAVREYRNRLAPIIFTLTLKIYPELFRFVLGENNIGAGERPVDVENKTAESLQNGSLVNVSPVFTDKVEFDDWWQGRYRYTDFRLARNQITHDYYYFEGSRLKVKSDSGIVLLDWDTNEVFSFAQCVLEKAVAVR